MKKGNYIFLLVLSCSLNISLIFYFAFSRKALYKSSKTTVVEIPKTIAIEPNHDHIKKINYEFNLIREFEWNNGIDSLHKTGCDMDIEGGATYEGECPPPMGPDGLMANSSGDIYIFDLDQEGEGWGSKLYDQYGNLKKYAPGGRPIGFDAKGNVYLLDRVYDSQLNLIKTYMLPSRLSVARKGYVTNEGKLIFVSPSIIDESDHNDYIYECDPYSSKLVDDTILLKANNDPKFAEFRKRIPCNEIAEDKSPLDILYNNYSSIRTISIYAKIKGTIVVNEMTKQTYLIFLAIDDHNYTYWLYNPTENTNDKMIFNYFYIGIFDSNVNMISKLPYSVVLALLIEFPNNIDKYIYIEKKTGNIFEINGDRKKAQLIEWKIRKGY